MYIHIWFELAQSSLLGLLQPSRLSGGVGGGESPAGGLVFGSRAASDTPWWSTTATSTGTVGGGLTGRLGTGIGSSLGTGIGMGLGGGIGSTQGTSLGSGIGTGLGTGLGSGIGTGLGSGQGSGMGGGLAGGPDTRVQFSSTPYQNMFGPSSQSNQAALVQCPLV